MHAPVHPPIPVETLLLAYRSGIFPMADSREDTRVFWVEPRDRAIIPLDGIPPLALPAQGAAADRFTVTVDRAFEQVIRACAEPRPDHPETWISERIVQSYLGLHRAGHAHSVECWLEGADGHRSWSAGSTASASTGCSAAKHVQPVPDASKVALAWLVALLRAAGYRCSIASS
jgi:leucyl/phenylalanyl-tRNA---protein transferase